ncbi:unnamed protein product [Auanema sp. JU1783]|nr:unnamed protein product [Auanema sp. JU1783]
MYKPPKHPVVDGSPFKDDCTICGSCGRKISGIEIFTDREHGYPVCERCHDVKVQAQQQRQIQDRNGSLYGGIGRGGKSRFNGQILDEELEYDEE